MNAEMIRQASDDTIRAKVTELQQALDRANTLIGELATAGLTVIIHQEIDSFMLGTRPDAPMLTVEVTKVMRYG